MHYVSVQPVEPVSDRREHPGDPHCRFRQEGLRAVHALFDVKNSMEGGDPAVLSRFAALGQRNQDSIHLLIGRTDLLPQA
ncbi:MAG: hypothetical protein EA397_01610 [Deltaproteobacteria bacterium]|nr:MAG: hypothetical protein EA397_01610 [Deltaproteobacteria bacterium]